MMRVKGGGGYIAKKTITETVVQIGDMQLFIQSVKSSKNLESLERRD